MAYKICIYNEGTETVIHFPSADKTNPHLSKMELDEKVNDIDNFKFTISSENQGYDKLQEFKTKIKVIDINDNSIKFAGRILSIDEQMDSTGLFYKEVSCENALAYLLDINSRNQVIISNDLTTVLTDVLTRYNNGCIAENRINLGNITAIQNNISYSCNYESIYATICNILKNNSNYYLQVRENNGSLYLDCLQSLNSNTPEVRLGVNMKELIKTKDITNLATRIIPLGANNLSISSVNNGIDYIEDVTTRSLYGIIEKTVSYSDITDPSILKSTALADLNAYTQPLITLEIDAIDLSKLTKIKADEFHKGMNLHIVNPVMAIDTIVKIVECDVDLTKEYNPKLTLSNIPQTMQDIVSNLQNSSLQNDSVHNSVQIGDSFGFRVVNGKIIITINGQDGFVIDNDNNKVFFVDTDGKLCAIELKTNNGSNYIQLHDQYLDIYHDNKVVMSLGYFTGIAGDVKQIKFEKAVIEEGMNSSDITITTDNLSFGSDGSKIVADQKWVRQVVDDNNNWWYENYFQNAKDDTFTTADGKTVTVTKGIVTNIQ